MVGHSHDKTLTKNFANKAWISKILSWLNCMTALIFWMQNFFAWVIFGSFFPKMMDQKVTPAKKVSNMKNQLFHARQPCAEIFDFCTQYNCNFSFFVLGAGSIHLQSLCIYDLITKVYIVICNFSFIWMTTLTVALSGSFMSKLKS